MNVINAIQNYVQKMISDVSGMKVLLLDDDTTPMISMISTQSQLLSKEIYLIEKLQSPREQMKHLKCILFLRPTPLSINQLVSELRENPCYGDYFIYFTNTLKKSDIERIAEADEYEVVREIQEYYGDYLAINPDLFSFNINQHLLNNDLNSWDPSALSRTVQGLMSVLLSLKKKPLIRFEKTSILGKKLASECHYQIQQEGPLFDFRKQDTPTILLILDRRNDPVTPLLNQWTYQALVHEQIGIQNARVDLSYVADIRPEMKEVVLSFDNDLFYQKNMFLNIGDLGMNIKKYVDEYQVKHHSSKNIESIADMKKFVEDYPEFRKLSGNVSKHVTLVGELSRLVSKEMLLELGELEQSLACIENHANDSKQFLEQSKISNQSKLKLVLLYALRYEKTVNNTTFHFIDLLKQQGLDPAQVDLIQTVLKYAGADQRLQDIFLNGDLIARTKNVFQGLKGVENVYTQHTPALVKTLTEMSKGKLKDQLYPFIDGSTRDRPQEIIVFVLGGVTYAEAREVNKWNTMNPGIRAILGGTTVHNSKSFLESLHDCTSKSLTGKKTEDIGLQYTVKTSTL